MTAPGDASVSHPAQGTASGSSDVICAYPPAPETGETAYRYLVGLIRALPEGYRRVLELKCVEEESNREIARRLGLKESTVATRVLRGRTMLAEALKKEGDIHG